MKKKVISILLFIACILMLFNSNSYGIGYADVRDGTIDSFLTKDYPYNESYSFRYVDGIDYGANDVLARYCMCLGHVGGENIGTLYLKSIIDLNNPRTTAGNNNVTVYGYKNGWKSNSFKDNNSGIYNANGLAASIVYAVNNDSELGSNGFSTVRNAFNNGDSRFTSWWIQYNPGGWAFSTILHNRLRADGDVGDKWRKNMYDDIITAATYSDMQSNAAITTVTEWMNEEDGGAWNFSTGSDPVAKKIDTKPKVILNSTDNSTWIGPYKIDTRNDASEITCKVSKITCKIDGTSTSINEWGILKNGKITSKGDTLYKIANNTEIYLKVSDKNVRNSEISNVKMTLKGPKKYVARALIFGCTDFDPGQIKALYNGKTVQDSTTLTLTNPERSVDLSIIKKNIKGNGQNGVNFKLYSEAKKKYIKIDGNNCTYESFSNSSTFTTSGGKVTINDLPIEAGPITIVEIGYTEDVGTNIYSDPVKIKETSLGTVGTITEGNNTYACVKNVDISNNTTVKVTIKDINTSGYLKIIKKDKNTGKPLQGVKFRVFLEKATNLNDVTGWVTGEQSSNGIVDLEKKSYKEYLSQQSSNDGIFTTNSSGEIRLKGIVSGTYRIYEVESIEGYDLDNQEGYGSDTNYPNWRYCGRIQVEEGKLDQENKFVYNETTIYNIQTRGNLDILKVDSVTKESLSGVQFKLKLKTSTISGHNGEWLKGSNFLSKALKDILGEENAAGVYTTGKDGIHLNGIPVGTYEIYETKSSPGYDMEGQASAGGTYNSTKDWVYWKTVTVVAGIDKDPVVKEIANTQTRGNLDILKEDSVTKEPLSGVQFKLKLLTSTVSGHNGEWLKGTDFSGKNIGELEEILVKEENAAGVYTTDKDGYIHLRGIPEGTYEIYEIKADAWHDMEGQTKEQTSGEGEYDSSKDWVDWKTVPVVAGIEKDPVVKKVDNIKTRGKLDLEKYDSIYNELKLEGAEFKLKLEKCDVSGFDGKWLKGSNFLNNRIGNILGDEKSASVYTTDKDGLVHFEGIPYGTYRIYEVKAPDGYDITEQDGYDDTKGWVDLGIVTISLKENPKDPKKVELENDRIIAKISGFVWLDVPDANKEGLEQSSFDSLWGTSNEEEKLGGIPVALCVDDNNGNARTIATGITNTKDSGKPLGEYEFKEWTKDATATNNHKDDKRIYYWDLVNAYVTFTYDNKQYVCVDPFEDGVKQIPNNSKAKELVLEEAELDDSNNSTKGVAQTLKDAEKRLGLLEPKAIIAENYDDEKIHPLAERGLTGYVKEKTINKTTTGYVIENINLGLWRKYKPSFSIVENIQYSKIRLNGYTYTYDYANGDSGKLNNNYSGPEVSFQQGAKTYGAVVYPSDIMYTKVAARENGLQMYVVYKIDITNTTTTNWKNIYSEYMMYINSLVNSYDSERFEVCSDTGERETWTGHEYFGLWSAGTDERETYKQTRYNLNGENGITGDKLSEGLEPGKTKSVYIQFKANQSYLEEMLTANVNKLNEQMKNYATSATADVYHAYYRADNVWDYEGSAHRYRGARGEERKGEFLHRTENENKQSSKLLLVLRLGDTRTISGTVFEDVEENPFNPGSETMQEALGNGIMDNGEKNRASGVKVELINAIEGTSERGTEGPQIAKLYDKNYPGGSKDAVETTGTDGKYTFSGVVPGLYYLRFTYSDGSTKIVDAGGNLIDLKSRDYKSTIIDKNGGQTGLLYNATELGIDKATEYLENWKYQSSLGKNSDNDQKYVEWYKYLDGKSYNIATDDINLRNALGEYTYDENGKVINSRGEEITTFGKVYSNSPYFSISIENDTQSVGTFSKEMDKVDEIHKPLYDRFHFGLIKVPQTNIKIDKVISNIKLINTQGTVLSQGDPKNTTDYVTALDKLGVGSKYARIEMEMQNIYGSQVETTYQVTISNLSEEDYIELDPNNHYGDYFKYGDKTNAKLKQTTIEKVEDNIDKDYDIADANLDEHVSHPEGSRENAGTTVTNNGTIIAKATETSTENNIITFENWSGIEAGGNTKISYIVKGLFQENMDLDYNNSVRIVSFKADTGTTLQSNYTWPERSDAKLVVTPDTGENRSPIYFIIGTIALMILATGIIIIKKKVIK